MGAYLQCDRIKVYRHHLIVEISVVLVRTFSFSYSQFRQ